MSTDIPWTNQILSKKCVANIKLQKDGSDTWQSVAVFRNEEHAKKAAALMGSEEPDASQVYVAGELVEFTFPNHKLFGVVYENVKAEDGAPPSPASLFDNAAKTATAEPDFTETVGESTEPKVPSEDPQIMAAIREVVGRSKQK